MNLFLLLSIPLGLLFLGTFCFPQIQKREILKSLLGGSVTIILLFFLYWPYSSGFRLPWNPVGLGFYYYLMEHLLFLGPLILSYWFIEAKSSLVSDPIYRATLWLGGGLAMMGIRDFLLSGEASTDLELFFQPLVRLLFLITLPYFLAKMIEKRDFWLNLLFIVVIPLGTSLLAVLNYYQWGWISYVFLLPLLGGSAYFIHQRLTRM